MKHSTLAQALLLLLVPAVIGGEMKKELKIGTKNYRVLQTRFSTYGYHDRQTIFLEKEGVRLLLPAGVPGGPQTGVYSQFALAGDCEVLLTYQLLKVEPPRTGYGCGVGLAFDLGGNRGRADLQRVLRTGKESGYALHAEVAGKTKQEEERFVASAARWGRLGLRRLGKELTFLVADEAGELREVERLPFSDRTVRGLRVFVDPGGSPSAVDVRIAQIEMRAEEITGGIPKKDLAGWSRWWWLLAGLPPGALLVWRWREQQRRSG